MKKLLLLLSAVGMIFTACEGGDGVEEENGDTPSTPKIELAQQSIEVEFEPAEYEVAVTSPYSWEATSKNDWIVVDTPNGIAGTKMLKFSVVRNEEEDIREGTIVVKNEDYNLVAELYVIQKAFVPAITIEPESLNFTAEGGTQEIAITANFDEYEASANADWLTVEKSEKGVNITATTNAKFEERTAEITISSEKYGISKAITITQQGVSAESKNVIIYTSSNGNIVTPYATDAFGANIVSNIYENGQGVIIFDAPITSIENYAFNDCTSLTSVTIPDSVTSIGNFAFRGCSSLTSVTIGSGVTSIGGGAFRDCSSLTSVTIPDSVTEIGNAAFSGCSSLTSIAIPDSVTSIGGSAFFNCSSLTSVTIPNSVTSIGERAFYNCSSLTAFYGEFASEDNRCLIVDGVLNSFAPSGLTSYTIPDSVAEIGEYAFRRCSSLTSVTIPDSVTSIGDYAFSGCSSLTSVYCKPTTPPTGGKDMFFFNGSGRKIYVPTASVSAYKSAPYWNNYASSIEGYDF